MLCVICEEGSVELIEEFDKNNVPCYYYVCKDGCGAEYADAELVRKNKQVYLEYLNNLCNIFKDSKYFWDNAIKE